MVFCCKRCFQPIFDFDQCTQDTGGFTHYRCLNNNSEGEVELGTYSGWATKVPTEDDQVFPLTSIYPRKKVPSHSL